jgi:hypothetical protein
MLPYCVLEEEFVDLDRAAKVTRPVSANHLVSTISISNKKIKKTLKIRDKNRVFTQIDSDES